MNEVEESMKEATNPICRRAFLRGGALVLLGAAGASALGDKLSTAGQANSGTQASSDTRAVRVGMVTDLHYADKPAAGTRHYRQSLSKMAEAAERFNRDQADLVVELGDFVDAAATPAAELQYLKSIHEVLATIKSPKHFVLGNHCVDTLTKQEFLDGVGQKESFYSFDAGNTHFIVLDGCFRADGKPYGRKNSKWDDANMPALQVDWLRDDLKATNKKVIVFVHQRLDNIKQYAVKNAAEVRKVLEQSGKVRAVFQGHSHANDYQEIGGIHYCTLVAMVEGAGAQNSGYTTMDVFEDDAIRINGFRKQKMYKWT
jgi:alkaline phosphatase